MQKQLRSNMKLAIALLFFFLAAQVAFAQAMVSDSIKELTEEQFIEWVNARHPVAKQAQLLSAFAQAEIRLARGGLDPKVLASFGQKSLNGKINYTDWDSYVSIPTWYGVDFKGGFERHIGNYINPEDATPVGGLAYFGVSVPLGQGMFIDQRRAAILQAKQLATLNEAEKVKVINKLLLQAAKDYYDWHYSYQEYKLAKLGLDLAIERYNATKLRAEIGEIATIDTVEAKITLQDRQIALAQAEVALQNARLYISNYLWTENGTPLEISTKLIPFCKSIPPVAPSTLDSLKSAAQTRHPELVKIRTKGVQLSIERKLASELLKPSLNIAYNVLDYVPITASQYQSSYFSNNYKIGANFSMPLFLRKERGKLKLTQLKIEQNNLEALQTNREIQNQIQANFASLSVLNAVLAQQEKMIANYELLRAAEIDKFSIGESSLFLVNSRESKLLEGKLKYAELTRKLQKGYAELFWAAGTNSWITIR